MLPDPFFSGICIGFVGTANAPRFIIKDERCGQATLYWDGTNFSLDRCKALIFADYEKVVDEAWRLRGDFIWGWLGDLFANECPALSTSAFDPPEDHTRKGGEIRDLRLVHWASF